MPCRRLRSVSEDGLRRSFQVFRDRRRKSVETPADGAAERQVHLRARRNDDQDSFSVSTRRRFTSVEVLLVYAKTRRPSSSSIAVVQSGAARDRA